MFEVWLTIIYVPPMKNRRKEILKNKVKAVISSGDRNMCLSKKKKSDPASRWIVEKLCKYDNNTWNLCYEKIFGTLSNWYAALNHVITCTTRWG